MLRSTLFIAVQCSQCSNMQVKQQKKSSNKWTCVVCNQKQSVRKIYAQGYQAKDIRLFVQSFNMCRKVADEQVALPDQNSSLGHSVEQLEGKQEKAEKKRADWSEYVVDEEDADPDPAYLKSLSKEKGDFEPEIATEFPGGEMPKKPKMKRKFDSSSSSGLGKPGFYKRYANANICNSQFSTKEITETQPRLARVESVPDENAANDKELPRNARRGWQQQTRMATTKKGTSKWSVYMAEDEGNCLEADNAAFADDLKLISQCDVEVDVTYQSVEEDIHPDFM